MGEQRYYMGKSSVMVPCPCGDENCEVEVDAEYGLDVPWRVTKVPTQCATLFARFFTPVERGRIIHTAYELNAKYEEQQFDRAHE